MRHATIAVLFAAGLACVPAAPVLAAESVSIGLTGLLIKNATNQTRSSSPATIDPATNYRYEFSPDTAVKGQGLFLAAVYPNPVLLADLLESFEAGSSALLEGDAPNPGGTHPAIVLDEPFSGSSGGASISLRLTAGIGADDIAFFSITEVVINPAFAGNFIFTSGTVTITRAPFASCGSTDFDGDGDEGTDGDIEAFFAAISGNPCGACGSTDFDGDGDEGTDSDIEAFFRVIAGGPCTL